MVESTTNWTTRLNVLIGTTEKHDLQIVTHRWSGKVEVSLDNEQQDVYDPKKTREELNLAYTVGKSEVHEIIIKRNKVSEHGVSLIIDGSLDYIL